MSLLLNTKFIGVETKKSATKSITILSKRDELRSKIAEQIRAAGFNQINEIPHDILAGVCLKAEDMQQGIIIDIAQHQDIEAVVAFIKLQVASDCWCILVGDNDSISIAERFHQQGVLYLHSGLQLNSLAQRIMAGIPLSSKKEAFIIRVLGCRGGVGTSVLSFQLAQLIAQLRTAPTLLTQSQQGAADLDLISEKKMDNEIVSYQKNIDLMLLNQLTGINENELIVNNYKFILVDQEIHNINNEKMEQYIQESNCMVLLFDHSLSAIRVAKNFLTLFERLKKADQRSTRLITCSNMHRLMTDEMLTANDIERLLEQKIAVKIPYIKQINKKVSTLSLQSQSQQPLLQLARLALGIKNDNTFVLTDWLHKTLPFLKSATK